jgi:hypothetical protein
MINPLPKDMKTVIAGIVIGIALLTTLCARAQIDTSTLQQVPYDQLPNFGTYWHASTDGRLGAPWPNPPEDPTVPVFDLGDGVYYVDDGGALMAGSGGNNLMALSMDSSNGNDDGSGGDPLVDARRNSEKFAALVFSALDTNVVCATDTNLCNALQGFRPDTNTYPTLQIMRYGTNSVLIRANHFDYSAETRDFALLVCDKVETPVWKNIDLVSRSSDSQDGWLIEGLVPSWMVADPMYFMVSNTLSARTAFFRAIPYSGPQITLTGPDSYSTVSNTVVLQASTQDLTGTTNQQLDVSVGGLRPRYTLAANNTINLDTRYAPNNYEDITITVANTNGLVVDPITFVSETKLIYSSCATLTLDFENDTYVVFASDTCSTAVGTNYITFGISKAQTVLATISDPSNGQALMNYSNYFPFATTVTIPWNFTKLDGHPIHQ